MTPRAGTGSGPTVATAGRRLAVLGAGPVGLEAAARGVADGFGVTVLEAGEVAQHVLEWGHVRLFTPFGMNGGPAGLALLGVGGGRTEARGGGEPAEGNGRRRQGPAASGRRLRGPAGSGRRLRGPAGSGRRLRGPAGSGRPRAAVVEASADPAARLPGPELLLTGREFRDCYLLPLARRLSRLARLETGARVIAVGRRRLLKEEAIGGRERSIEPFRILYERGGREVEIEAEVVLDCTGTYGTPNWLGPGGTPARGERALRHRIVYGLPDVLGADRPRFAGKRVLVVGSGHSAATTALALTRLREEAPDTTFLWLTRGSGARPLEPIPTDPLPERDALAARANALALDLPHGCRWRGGARVLEVAESDGGFRVRYGLLAPPGSGDTEEVVEDRFDAVVANVGYEPDDSLYRQLQIHECYATRGPMKLSAALLGAAGDGPADCLALGGFGPETLTNPEPDFFILGMKSFGRNAAFLLRTGYEQVRDVFDLLRRRSPGRGSGRPVATE